MRTQAIPFFASTLREKLLVPFTARSNLTVVGENTRFCWLSKTNATPMTASFVDTGTREGRAISDAPFPSALGTLQSPPNPGTPPKTSINPAIDARVRASIRRKFLEGVETWAVDQAKDRFGAGLR